jgi:hypothetical protein
MEKRFCNSYAYILCTLLETSLLVLDIVDDTEGKELLRLVITAGRNVPIDDLAFDSHNELCSQSVAIVE